jgi:hypothetical protein
MLRYGIIIQGWTHNKSRYLSNYKKSLDVGVRVMVFKNTFNTVSAISWRSALLVKEIRVNGKKHQPAASH